MTENYTERVGKIELLIGEIESTSDAATRERVRELVDILLDVHGAALERMLEAAADSVELDWLLALCERDELLSSVLMLHGIHPISLEARVQRALEDVQPYLASHKGGVDLAGIADDGTVYLRLRGSCNGCPSSSATLKYAIEEAVYTAAPDVTRIQVVEAADESSDDFIPISEMLWDECPFPATSGN